MLTSKGYGLLKKNINIEEVVSELTVKPYGDFIQTDEFCVCLETSKYLYVPKYYGIQKFGYPVSVKLPESESITLNFRGELLETQQDPVRAYLEAARDPLKMGGILQLPPGAGKTVMALYILCELGVKTLIIVHKEFLLNQWKERIEQYVTGATVGIIKQKVVETEHKIVIASLQSLCMKEYSSDVFSSFGMVIVDECHHIGAQIFSKALYKVNFKYALGLSATVNRKDGLSKVFKWFIGDIVYKVSQKQNVDCEVKVCTFRDENRLYREESLLYNGKVNMARMINNVTAYGPRTKFIVNEIVKTLEENSTRNVIVLSDRRSHLQEMHKMLGDEGYSTGLYVGGMKNEQLDESKERQIILGTFNMVSEGFDLPKLDTLVLSTSKSDIEQAVGRIQRKHIYNEDDNIPLVIDIVDDFSVFANQYKKRKTFYKKKNYKLLGE